MLIDECQDTNPAQYEWVKLLLQDYRNLRVVADADQAHLSLPLGRGAERVGPKALGNYVPTGSVQRLKRQERTEGGT